MRALAVVEHFAVRHRNMLASTIIQSLLVPVAYLGAMGLGLGSLIDETADADALAAPDYLSFVAPAIAVAAAMQAGVSLTAWPVLGALRWERTFHAMAATPARVVDIVVGFLGWLGLRLFLAALGFVAIMTVLGASHSPAVVLVPVVATVTGLAFAAPMAAFSATRETDSAFAPILRFVVMPLFLLGGVFFPIEQLPGPLAAVVRATPLWHGVAAARDLALGDAAIVETGLHLLYPVVCVLAGGWWMTRTLGRRLAS